MQHLNLISKEDMQRAALLAREFLTTQQNPLGLALIDHLVADGPASDVVTALAAYQNEDGGFGRGLEVDIAAPASNPFATRLAMQVLLLLPAEARTPMLPSLQAWLEANQAPDGDWHLSAATRSGDLAPWFAAWQHPALNPACCVTGLANRLGIATTSMLERTASLFSAGASIEQVAQGTFYDLLPYAEYLTAIQDIENRDAWLDTFAERIRAASTEIYADAGHFWEQVLALGGPIIERLPSELLASNATHLMDEQEADGSWPSPYSPAWQPWITSMAIATLYQLAPAAR